MAEFLPTSVLLPDYARSDLATFNLEYPPMPGAGSGYSHTTESGFLELLTSLHCQFSTGAGAGNRSLSILYLDDQSRTVASATQLVNVGTASDVFLQWSIDVTTAFVNTGGAKVYSEAPLPRMVLWPNWRFLLTADGSFAGDQFSSIVWTSLQVPTGPPRAPVVLTPTPLLV